MVAIVYPSSLPGPQPGSFDPRPRRATSSIDGPLQQRARQRDAAGMTSQYTFVYTPAQMAVWRDWWRDDLLNGRRWFAMPLPGAGGLIPRVVRYRSVQQQLLGAGLYRVSATFEQRGASVLPEPSEGDPFFADVVLLMHYQGDFVDVKGHDVFTTGAPGFTSLPAGPVLTGGHSLFAGGTPTAGGGNARLYTEFSNDFDLTSDFTMEQWSYVPYSQSRPRAFLSIRDDSDGALGDGDQEYYIGIPTGGTTPSQVGAGYPSALGLHVISQHDVDPTRWEHSFLQRRGNDYAWGIGGFIRGVSPSSYRQTSGPKRVFIGQDTLSLSIDGFYGYLAESRITRAARYSGFVSAGDAYSVPTFPFLDR